MIYAATSSKLSNKREFFKERFFAMLPKKDKNGDIPKIVDEEKLKLKDYKFLRMIKAAYPYETKKNLPFALLEKH